MRIHVNNEIRKSKQAVNDNLAEKLNSYTLGPKDWWKILKQIIKPSESSNIPPLCNQGELFSDNKDKAEVFNDFFSSQNTINETNASLPEDNFENRYNETIDSIHLSPSEVETCLKSLKTGKAAGPDTLNNRILKALSSRLSSPVCDLFNYSLSTGQFPEAWKQADITPIYKKDDSSDPSNYHPISLLSAVGKVFEKLVYKYVFSFCVTMPLLLLFSQVLLFFTSEDTKRYKLWSCQNVCEALIYLLDNIYIRFGTKLYRQIVCIPMGTNCAPLVADLFLFCYERDFMTSLSDIKQAEIIEAFKSISRYLDDLLNIDNPYFEGMINRIYPPELQLNKANTADTEAPLLDLHLSISNGFVSSKFYDKRDDFDFDIHVINFPFLDGDVPGSTTYGVYISQLIWFARVSSHVVDFNARIKSLTAKLLQQGYRYHKLRKTFSKFYRRHYELVQCWIKNTFASRPIGTGILW